MERRYRSRRARLAATTAVLRSQGLSWADIASRIQRDEGVTPLVAFRLARGMTQRQIAERWNSLYAGTSSGGTITDKQISYWEAWPRIGHEPSLRTLKRLARIFECTISELVEDGNYTHLDTARHPLVSTVEDTGRTNTRTLDDQAQSDAQRLHWQGNAPQELFPNSHCITGADEDEDMRRRSLLVASGAAVLGAGVPNRSRTQEALQIVSLDSPQDLDTTIDSLSELVTYYSLVVSRTPSTAVYDDLLALRKHAGSLRTRIARGPSRQGDLTVVAGWLAGLLAAVATDLGDHASALVWCTDAERRGMESGHSTLLGWASLTKSLIAYYHGQASRSADIAVRGQAATSLGTVVHARLAAQEMRARAMLKDARGMVRAQRTASRSIDAIPPDAQTMGGTFSISLSSVPPYTATSLLLVGRYEEAAQQTRHILDTVYHHQPVGGGPNPTKYSRSLLILGMAEAALGHIEEACEVGNKALESSQPVWPTMVLAEQLMRTLDGGYAQNHHVLGYRRHFLDVANSVSGSLILPARNERDE